MRCLEGTNGNLGSFRERLCIFATVWMMSYVSDVGPWKATQDNAASVRAWGVPLGWISAPRLPFPASQELTGEGVTGMLRTRGKRRNYSPGRRASLAGFRPAQLWCGHGSSSPESHAPVAQRCSAAGGAGAAAGAPARGDSPLLLSQA